MEKSFDDTIEEMRAIAEMLVPYTHPQNDPALEQDINLLRTSCVVVDGYDVVMVFLRADYGEHYIETLLLRGKNTPFLPFHVVVKLAKKFLGGYDLLLSETFRNNRKVYCWNVFLNKDGKPTKSPFTKEYESCKYDGIDYIYVNPGSEKFH